MNESARVLTVRQPWAWAIIHAGKDVENRTWATKHRGPLLIHAGSRLETDALPVVGRLATTPLPESGEFDRGAIIGVVDLVDCVQGFDSSWADEDAWHWLLARPRPFERPYLVSGRLSLWRPPPDLRW